MDSELIKAPNFLLPKGGLERWATIACDQHTADASYWEKLEELVSSSPSALRLILPEVYLESPKRGAIEKSIAKKTDEYLNSDIFIEKRGFVLIKRKTSFGKIRTGILLLIDLEEYSFEQSSKAPIRASEGTVKERIPARVKVKENALLELSHIMLLYDDPENIVVRAAESAKVTPLYNFTLNMNGGDISGSLIDESEEKSILKGFNSLKNSSIKKYGAPFLFAVGDGNHSLAAAKTVYEKQKLEKKDTTISRYALCEAVNIYDPALLFEPIHRVAFIESTSNAAKEFFIKKPKDAIEYIQYTDQFFEQRGIMLDYIHGKQHLEKVAAGKTAIEMLPIEKSGFFPYIEKNGALPKKTFSMGEAEDKRYYLEVRKLI